MSIGNVMECGKFLSGAITKGLRLKCTTSLSCSNRDWSAGCRRSPVLMVRFALIFSVLVASAPSAAEVLDTTPPMSGIQCVNANDAALDAKSQGRLLEARKYIAQCARLSCPAVIREECTKLSSDWATSQPRLTFEIVGASGEPLSDVRVWVDGAPVDLSAALEVDPGKHEATFKRDGYVEMREVFDVKDRNSVWHVALTPVAVQEPAAPKAVIQKAESLAALPQLDESEKPALDTDSAPSEEATVMQEPDASSPSADSLSTAQFVGAIGVGVGVLALATGGAMLILANSDHEQSLDSGCNANAECTTPRGKELADAARDKANLATPFVLGGAALVLGGAALFLIDPFDSEPDVRRAGKLQVQPLIGLGVGGVNVTGRF